MFNPNTNIQPILFNQLNKTAGWTDVSARRTSLLALYALFGLGATSELQ